MHPLQSSAWEEFKKATGINTSRVDGLLITWHHIPFTPFTVGYLPKSELPTLPQIKNVEKEAKRKGAVLVRMEPDATRSEAKKWLRAYGELLRPGRTLFTPQTFYLYLDKSEEDLLAAMHPKARYNIRLAQKKGVVIEEDNSPEAFTRYLQLTFGETTQRQKFYAHNIQYHQKMWQIMHQAKIAHLFTAKYKGQILVTWILFKYQHRLFFPYGASSDAHKEVQAPSLMLWETARWGKKNQCLVYDLWGAEAGKGFNRFKEQFGPQLIDLAGTWDLVVNPILYPVYRVAENIRWKILRAIK